MCVGVDILLVPAHHLGGEAVAELHKVVYLDALGGPVYERDRAKQEQKECGWVRWVYIHVGEMEM